MKLRKIPKGWRILTPTEKIDASCMHNLKSHDSGISNSYIQQEFTRGNPSANGYIKTIVWFGTLVSAHPTFVFIKPLDLKQSVTVTLPLDTTVGTEVANGVESARQ